MPGQKRQKAPDKNKVYGQDMLYSILHFTSNFMSFAGRDAMSQATNDGLHVFLAIQPETKPSLFWEICKKPNMISICKSAVRLISLWLNRRPERVCSACGSLTLNYTSHCLLWCNVYASHKMWNGIWRKFGVDLSVRLGGFDSETLLSVLFDNYGLIADLLYCSPIYRIFLANALPNAIFEQIRINR